MPLCSKKDFVIVRDEVSQVSGIIRYCFFPASFLRHAYITDVTSAGVPLLVNTDTHFFLPENISVYSTRKNY